MPRRPATSLALGFLYPGKGYEMAQPVKVHRTARLAAALLAMALFRALAPAAPIPRGAESPEFYFPTEVGTKIIMRSYRGESTSDSIYRVTAVEQKGTAKLVTVSWTAEGLTALFDGNPIRSTETEDPNSKYLVSANGVYVVASYLLLEKKWEEYKTPRCLLKLPAKPGDRWTNEEPASQYKMTATVGKPEKVKVPAGTFDAIPVNIEATHEGKPVPRRTIWFAAGIGQIKSTVDDEVAMELISFTPGKK